METAHSIAAPHALAVTPLEAVIECDVGRWEGLTWADIEVEDPDAYRRFTGDPAEHPYTGGENLRQVRDRVAPALDRLLTEGDCRGIAVVAHNIVNRVYLAGHLGVPLAQARGIPQANGAVNILRGAPGPIRLMTVNSVLHLTKWE
jgi:broad specificity phosphatase PhoE